MFEYAIKFEPGSGCSPCPVLTTKERARFVMAIHKLCSVSGCGKLHIARGLCGAHYAKLKKYGDPLASIHVPARTTCSVEGCVSEGRIKLGFCNRHYMRLKSHGDPTFVRKASAGAPMRFIEELVAAQVWPQQECIAWPFGKSDGYGAVNVAGESRGAHCIICEAVHGPAPSPDHEVRHTCFKGDEGCINPNHLEWATHRRNMEDTVGLRSETAPRGERQWMAKLTEQDVIAIRTEIARGVTQQVLAERYGVRQPTISAIHRRKKWAWLQ